MVVSSVSTPVKNNDNLDERDLLKRLERIEMHLQVTDNSLATLDDSVNSQFSAIGERFSEVDFDHSRKDRFVPASRAGSSGTLILVAAFSACLILVYSVGIPALVESGLISSFTEPMERIARALR